MTKSKSWIVACVAVAASLGALAAPASARPMMMHHHRPMMVHHRMMMHHHPMMMHHHMRRM